MLNGAQEGPGAHAGQEDHDIEGAVDQLGGKTDRILIRLERHLAQRRREEADTSKLRNERRDLRASTALQREDARALKTRSRPIRLFLHPAARRILAQLRSFLKPSKFAFSDSRGGTPSRSYSMMYHSMPPVDSAAVMIAGQSSSSAPR